MAHANPLPPTAQQANSWVADRGLVPGQRRPIPVRRNRAAAILEADTSVAAAATASPWPGSKQPVEQEAIHNQRHHYAYDSQGPRHPAHRPSSLPPSAPPAQERPAVSRSAHVSVSLGWTPTRRAANARRPAYAAVPASSEGLSADTPPAQPSSPPAGPAAELQSRRPRSALSRRRACTMCPSVPAVYGFFGAYLVAAAQRNKARYVGLNRDRHTLPPVGPIGDKPVTEQL